MNKQDKPLKVAIKTFGCQMNAYDSEVAEGLMHGAGFEIIPELAMPSPNAGQAGLNLSGADVILLNTCSVREGAEEKVFGHLGVFGKAKRTNPNLVVGLMGCMVEEHKEKLFKRFPQIDLMVGTRNIKELPAMVNDVLTHRRQISKIKQDGISIEYTDQIKRRGTFHAWLPVMTGCNKVCTFCIVPITRGSEVSMPARDVYREASRLVSEGVKWITLLGQNVNSYKGQDARFTMRDAGKNNTVPPESGILNSGSIDSSFPELLDMLCEIKGLEAISFTTSHPHDATLELYKVIAKNPKISRRFHLPLQSGSNVMLKRMKRLHTYEEYRDKIDSMRSLIPDVSLTTDIITGFSGETDADHEATAQALREIRYDGAYIYKYSVRPGTPAAKLEDDVPRETKEKRNAELLTIQDQIRNERNRSYIGRTLDIFAESVNSRETSQLIGRSREEKRVVFEGSNELIGSFHQVMINDLKNETFFGKRK